MMKHNLKPILNMSKKSSIYRMSLLVVGFIFLIAIPPSLLSDIGLSIYEKGYKLEKEYPLYSIPLYERSLHVTQDPKLKRIAATRLYYLYKRFQKYPDLLVHHSRYKALLSIGSEHESTIREICKIYKITSQDFYQVYPLLFRMDSEEIGNFLEIITHSENKNLFTFSYSFLIARKKFEELRTIMFYLPESIASPVLRIGLLVKMNDDNAVDAINRYLERDDLTDKEKSDALYLLGQQLMQTGNYSESEKVFTLSNRAGDGGRGLREKGKLLILQGRIQEACSLTKYPKRDFHESDFLLYLVCEQSGSAPKELRDAVRILAENESRSFFQATLPLL